MPSAPRERHLSEISPEDLTAAIAELAALIEPRFPQRIHRGEGPWPVAVAALVAQMLSTATSIAKLNAAGAHNDVLILLRALYEQVVTFCWLAIDRGRHPVEWANESHIERRKLHFDAIPYGYEILTEDEVNEIKLRTGMPPLIQRAASVDDFWSARIPGFRSSPKEGDKQILTLRGLYVGLYRTTSRAAHAQVGSLDAFVDRSRFPRYPLVVGLQSQPNGLAAIAVPLVTLALLVCNHRLRWPDAEAVARLNAALLHDVNTTPATNTIDPGQR